jgi:outer membrane usher protein FimD/PapC
VGISKTFSDAYSSSIQYSEDLLNNTSGITVNISKSFKPVSLSLSVSQQSNQAKKEDDTSVFLTVSLNSFTDSKTLKTQFLNQENSYNSGVRAKVFVDKNNNGLFDSGEMPVVGANVLGFGRKKVSTNQQGEALLLGSSSSSSWQDVSVDTESLSEPSWRAGSSGFAILPRGGRIAELDFPVISTADIEGTVTLVNKEGKSRLLGSITIQAVRTDALSGKQKVIAEIDSSYDGFYSLSGVPLGNISLRIDPEQVSRLAITKGNMKQLQLDENTQLLSEQNFVLSR